MMMLAMVMVMIMPMVVMVIVMIMKVMVLVMMLTNDGEIKPLLETYQAATSDDWNEGNLIPASVKFIGSLDISGYADGPRLKFIRNTSAKRQIASYFAVVGMTREDFETGSGVLHLRNFRAIAAKIGEVDAS